MKDLYQFTIYEDTHITEISMLYEDKEQCDLDAKERVNERHNRNVKHSYYYEIVKQKIIKGGD